MTVFFLFFFYEHFFGKFEDAVAEPRKPMLTLSNLLPHDFIFSLFPELDLFIDSGLNAAIELCVSETVTSVTKKKQINMSNKMRNEAQEKN